MARPSLLRKLLVDSTRRNFRSGDGSVGPGATESTIHSAGKEIDVVSEDGRRDVVNEDGPVGTTGGLASSSRASSTPDMLAAILRIERFVRGREEEAFYFGNVWHLVASVGMQIGKLLQLLDVSAFGANSLD